MARPEKVLTERFIERARDAFQSYDKEIACKKLNISIRTHQRYIKKYPEYAKAINCNSLENDPDIQKMLAELNDIKFDDISLATGETLNFISKDGLTKFSVSKEHFTDTEVERMKRKYRSMKFVSRETIPVFP